MRSFRYLALVFFALAYAFTLVAQPKQPRSVLSPEARAKMAVEQLSQKITLAESEVDSMQLIFTDFFAARTEALKSNAGTEEFDQIVVERDNRVRELLGEDRYVIYKKRVDEGTERLRNTQEKIKNRPGLLGNPPASSQDSLKTGNQSDGGE